MLLNILIYTILTIYTIIYVSCKLTGRRCTSKNCLIGKTAIITGGNRGIGLATALELASRGCRLIIACRSNAEELKQKIIKATKNPNIIVKHLDLMSLESVRNFAKNINQTETRLDILINNAGIGGSSKKHTQDDLHPVMQTNYFGPFLLTHLLINLMKKTPKSRLAFITSFGAYVHDLKLENLNVPEDMEINPFLIYGNSKLCEIIAAKMFAKKLKQFGINSNAIHPGIVCTNIFRTWRSVYGQKIVTLCFILFKMVVKTTEEAAQTIMKVVISDEYENITGRFVWDFQYTPTPARIKDKEFCEKIWEATENYVKLAPHEKL